MKHIEFMYITNDVNVALIAEEAGVDRIWIDLETLGKEERQAGINSVKSHHSFEDIKKISPLLTKSKMQVRINPWNENSKNEIETSLEYGAQYIMLPMWKTVDEVKNFLDIVNGRAKTILLLETKEAEECLDQVLKLDNLCEIHIGLNDLHLSYHLQFMFELLTNGTVERIVNKIKKRNIPFGFGGVSHLGDGIIPAEMIIAEHYRLGSTRAILSRGFCQVTPDYPTFKETFIKNLKDLREQEDKCALFTEKDFESNKQNIETIVKNYVEKKHE